MDILCSVSCTAELVINNKVVFIFLHLCFHVMKPHTDVSPFLLYDQIHAGVRKTRKRFFFFFSGLFYGHQKHRGKGKLQRRCAYEETEACGNNSINPGRWFSSQKHIKTE